MIVIVEDAVAYFIRSYAKPRNKSWQEAIFRKKMILFGPRCGSGAAPFPATGLHPRKQRLERQYPQYARDEIDGDLCDGGQSPDPARRAADDGRP